MSNRASRRLSASAVVCALVVAFAGQSAAHAGGVATGDCRLGDTQFLEGEPGSPQSQSQLCGGNYVWGTEATWYWTDEKLVIVEPRAEQFDYSAFSQLNPFTGDGYSFRKANELFPDTSRVGEAAAKLFYAQASLMPKSRALDVRKTTEDSDACQFYPSRYSDSDVEQGTGWLPPIPTADGKTGFLTYTLSSNLTPFQRSVILDALVQVGNASVGSRLPVLIPAPVADPTSTITFSNSGLDPEAGEDIAEARPTHPRVGRNGLRQWGDGDIMLTHNGDHLDALSVAHEILHVLGFGHLGFATTSATMGVSSHVLGQDSQWDITGGGGEPVVPAIDRCTKSAMQSAD